MRRSDFAQLACSEAEEVDAAIAAVKPGIDAMSEAEPTDPTLKDIWYLLGVMNKRFDALDRQMVALRTDMAEFKADVRKEIPELGMRMQLGFGALRESIEARDFRLDEHGRRLYELEQRK